jgi:hypothetical protein
MENLATKDALATTDRPLYVDTNDEIFEYTNAPHTSYFIAEAATQSNVTGDNTSYTIQYSTTVRNVGSDFSTGTGIYTVPFDGIGEFFISVMYTGISGTHTELETYIFATSANRIECIYEDPTSELISGRYGTTGGSGLVELSQSDQVYVVVRSGPVGQAKTVDVDGGSYKVRFTGRMVYAL